MVATTNLKTLDYLLSGEGKIRRDPCRPETGKPQSFLMGDSICQL
jgi:hypothetical protein